MAEPKGANPFEAVDDVNPFASGAIEEYNPFVAQPQPPVAPQQQPQQQSDAGAVRQQAPQTQGLDDDGSSGSDDEITVEDKTSNRPVGAPTTSSGDTVQVPLDDPVDPYGFGDTSNLQGVEKDELGAYGVEPMEQEKKEKKKKKKSFFRITFFRKYFNVDTTHVLMRCLRSLFPFKTDFLMAARKNPDLYGPFWIATTVIFMMAAAGNFSSYISFKQSQDNLYWQYDFTKVSYGAAAIYGYQFLMPLVMWGAIHCWTDIDLRALEMICIYGYALFIYVPVALLCIIPLTWLRWVIIGIACADSTLFLVINIWMPLRQRIAKAFILLIVIAALHIGLALTFRLYFLEFY